MSSSRASSRPRYQIHVSHVSGMQADSLLLSHQGSPDYRQQNTKGPKKNPPNATSEELEQNRKSEAKAGCQACPLHPTPQRVGRTPKPPLWPRPWTHPCPQTRRGAFSVVPNEVLRAKSALFMHVGSRARLSEFKPHGCHLLALCLYLSSPMQIII